MVYEQLQAPVLAASKSKPKKTQSPGDKDELNTVPSPVILGFIPGIHMRMFAK